MILIFHIYLLTTLKFVQVIKTEIFQINPKNVLIKTSEIRSSTTGIQQNISYLQEDKSKASFIILEQPIIFKNTSSKVISFSYLNNSIK